MDKQKLHDMKVAVAALKESALIDPNGHPYPNPAPQAIARLAPQVGAAVTGMAHPGMAANLIGTMGQMVGAKPPNQPAATKVPIPQPLLGPMGATINQKGGAFAVLQAQMWEAVNALNKKAFVPGPQVQQALEQMSSDAANQQQQQQATQQASQQAQAQQQGAPPTMRLEDLAQMVQQLAQMLQQLPQQIQQMIQPMMQQMSAAGGGEQKKLSPQEMNQQILQKLDQISQGLGVAPAGGASGGGAPGAAPSPAPSPAPGAANSPQQQPQQSAGQGQPPQ